MCSAHAATTRYSATCCPRERPGPHIVGDVRDVLHDAWDLLIAHPPCTFLANSGAKHLYLGCRRENGAAGDRWANLGHAAAFFIDISGRRVPRIAVENPIMLGHVRRLFDIPAPSQTIQPWQFGHPGDQGDLPVAEGPAAADADESSRAGGTGGAGGTASRRGRDALAKTGARERISG